MALTNVQKVRLRVGDYNDLPWFQDAIYDEILANNNNNIVATSREMAGYILAMLTRSTRSKLAQLESYDQQQFEQYRQFLIDTVSNPYLMSPPTGLIGDDGRVAGTSTVHPLIQFAKNWNAGYYASSAYTADDEQQLFYDLAPKPEAQEV